MATAKTGNPRGRPPKPFLTDPDRYQIALFDALIFLFQMSERDASRMVTVLFSGEAVEPDGQAKKRPIPDGLARVAFEVRGPFTLEGRAATIRRKASQPISDEDAAKWRAKMALAFMVAFGGKPSRAEVVRAEIDALASEVGEHAFAQRVIVPMFEAKFATRISTPE